MMILKTRSRFLDQHEWPSSQLLCLNCKRIPQKAILATRPLVSHPDSFSVIKMEEKNKAGAAEPLRICSGSLLLQMRPFASTVTSY